MQAQRLRPRRQGRRSSSSSSKKARTEEWRGPDGRTAAEYSAADDYFLERDEVPDDGLPGFPEYCTPDGCLLVRNPKARGDQNLFRMAELPWGDSDDEAEAVQDAWDDIAKHTDDMAEQMMKNPYEEEEDEADEAGLDETDEADKVGRDLPDLPHRRCGCGENHAA